MSTSPSSSSGIRMWIRRLSLFVAVALSSSSSSSSFVGFVALGAAETECNAVENDTCSAAESLQPSGRRESSKSTNKHHPTAASQCGLYMAESSIPDSGWGVFLGYNTDSGNQTSAGLLLEEMKDVIVQVADLTQQARWKLELYNITLPYLILADYFWKSIETQSYFDADRIESTSPGLGMLVNAHLGLTNLEQAGCRTRLSGPRAHPTAGATSSYQDCVFVWATTTATASSAAKSIQLQLPPGHELFDDYGDQWFVKRPEMFGDELPLTNDYKRANGIVKLWQQKMERIRQRGSVSEDEDASASIDSMGSALWTTIVRGFGSYLPPRTRRALPLNASDAARIDLWTPTEKENSIFRNHSDEHYVGNTVAYLDVPNVIRSQAWLEDHGLCLDHIRVQPVAIPGRSHERGVVARRFVPAGAVVAPAPVVHLSRKHLEILLVDANGAPTTVLWQGHQLLLNYCYGHPESSVLLFPYSPGVNLINHPDRGESNQIPNVAIRWSKQMAYPEWLQLDALTLLHDKSHAGLMMEFYALRDINPGEDILLDYGNSWQTAWNEHVDAWEDRYQRRSKSGLDLPANVHNFTSAWDYIRQCENSILTDKENDCMYNTPSWIDVRCWIQTPTTLVASKDDNDDDDWLEWRPPENDDSSHRTLDDTLACEILSIDSDGTYRILVQRNSWVDVSAGLEVKKVPRSAIDFVDREYSGNQFMRSAFRHEIRLPEEMVPEAWKDLKSEPDNDCGLFMAESAIPNSGLGIYTSKSIPKGENIYFGEVAVHVEDYHLNTKLRHWAISEFSYNESDWLLDSYYWTPETSKGNFDADDDIQTIIPGFGMLLNSHTGLMNTDVTAPVRSTDLHRSRDPGTGASSSYHDVQFKAKIDVEAGSELYLEYGNSWFVDRVETFGMVPLSHDFIEADKLLSNFSYIFDESRDMPSGLNKELVSDALSILANITSSRPRLASIIPRDVASFQAAMERGTAELTLPNRIRSQDWLEKNGRCLDNIRPEKSTIRQAGRGAFATRSIKKSEIITSMPLAHLRRRHVDLYDGDNTSNTEGRFWLEGKQQLINYCFGHPDSSLLLFPYSPVVNYVNHNLTGYNAELVWSDLPTHRKDWFNRNPDEIEAEGHAGLVLEMVASRDIHAGEEIFLSYGDSWEAAWNAHLEQWSPSEYDLLYTSSIEMNQQLDWIRTVAELSIEPNQRLLADHVKTVCYVGSHIGLILSTLSDQTSVQTIKWKGKDNLFDTNDYAYSCVILERHDSQLMSDHVYDRKDSIKPIEVTYKVALKTRDDRVVMVEDVPRKAIQFFDAPYTTDDAMRTAFRHEIQLPDGMIPPAWRDLKPQTMHNTK